MYSQADMQRAKNGMIKMLSINIAIVLCMAALTIAGTVVRQLWMTMAGVVLMLCAGYFFYSFKTAPWINYYKFMRDMMNGKTRETEGVFTEINDEVRKTEGGIYVHDLYLDVEGEDVPLLFQWDEDKPLPQVEPGTRVKVQSYGRIVREMKVVTEA